jgi:hypothetical protein
MSSSRQHHRSRPAAQGHSIIPSSRQRPRRNLQNLTDETLELVAKYLRDAHWPIRWPPLQCANEPRNDRFFSLSTARANTYSDPAWALSCTSKRLRRIVFDGMTKRRTRLGFCHRCWSKASAVPQHVRDNVRYEVLYLSPVVC